MYEKRYPILRKAVDNFLKKGQLNDYYEFCNDNQWLDDYSLFMAIKKSQNDVGLADWDIKYRIKDKDTIEHFIQNNQDEINFWKTIQYLFFRQWFELKEYANNKGIKIIGDCPIYVSADSCDLWANPELYQVDDQLKPTRVAGCPPDGFSPTGQLWGNPLYEWDKHKETGYKWWISRVKHLSSIYDVLRIDHFRGLSAYYSIDGKAQTAKDGYWIKGPGKNLIQALKDNIDCDIIAEDLGFMDDDVKELLEYSKYPGMGVLEFGFDTRDSNSNDYIPYNLKKHSVSYIGTHDNETIMGWIDSIPKDQAEFVKNYVDLKDDDELNWKLIRCLWASAPDLTIVQSQDLLGLDNSARMNEPSTLGKNWKWRANKDVFNKEIAKKLADLTVLYGRA